MEFASASTINWRPERQQLYHRDHRERQTATAFCHRGHKDHKERQRRRLFWPRITRIVNGNGDNGDNGERRKYCYGKRPAARSQRTAMVLSVQQMVTVISPPSGHLCVRAVVVAVAVTYPPPLTLSPLAVIAVSVNYQCYPWQKKKPLTLPQAVAVKFQIPN